MKPSPVQARHIGFYSIEVHPRKHDEIDQTGTNFDWNGVVIGSPVKHFPIDDEPFSQLVTLDIVVKNEKAGKKAPYNIEICAWGAFECLNKETTKEEALDMLVVNGASMLYGAIRELLFTLTTRMVHNELMLPTVNFLDCKPSLQKSDSQPQAELATNDEQVAKRTAGKNKSKKI